MSYHDPKTLEDVLNVFFANLHWERIRTLQNLRAIYKQDERNYRQLMQFADS